MSLQKLKLSIYKHSPSSHSSQPSHPAAATTPVRPRQARILRPAQAARAPARKPFGPGPATVYIAVYKPPAAAATAPASDCQCGTNAIYIQNTTGPDILQRISQPTSSRPVLLEPQHDSIPARTELRFPLIKMGTIPKGRLTAARNILGLQKPGDGWKGGERYNSKDWVKLVLDWFADDADMAWEEGGQTKVKLLPVG